ncbi:HPr kinase/phosphatase C-terminal domain-containing protein [Pseudovibrio sp. Tun.PSC04-5.I4]|uniref:HPr kinase/phosphorylase n=1 Tax=Pseudovibrio sp. Tun.PSC04-5.I4 TaxID=1798213 RepID=UPI0008915356|nr:HPr kinase/phosphatase C-terminal domain-containing protein [Pseudovibrio sp. Tun.PSC04-5.I4]SDR23570.1 HPr Serine kinase C-terminal domain-containing protein [Pseudovibrio sp. Tun.PSC04-5.I4]
MTALDQKQSVQAATGQAIHATCVVIGKIGLLVRGKSGSGKTALGLELIHAARLQGSYAAMVADDRVYVTAKNNRLIATCPDQIQGKAELRGHGIVDVPYLNKALVHVVLDFEDLSKMDRIPDESALTCEICSVKLIRQSIPKEDVLSALRLAKALIFTNPVHN